MIPLSRSFCVSLVAAIAVFSSAGPARAEPDAKIARTFRAKCASCHGNDGKGQTAQGEKLKIPDMTSAAFQSGNTDEAMRKVINEGFKREGMPEGMDSYADKLTPEQITGLIAFVRSLK